MREFQMVLAMLFVCGISYPGTAQESSNAKRAEIVRRRQEWFYAQRAYPREQTPPGARWTALRQLDRIRALSSSITFAATTPWKAKGPQPTIPLPFPFAGSPAVSGRVTALAVDPTNSSVVYLGAAEGGVWKTIDGGTTWTPLTDSQPSLAIGSIAIDPSNHNTILVGTGEEHFAQDNYYGAGILKSTDGGSSWTHLPGPFAGPSLDTLDGGAYIGSLAVHPTNSSVVLAAARFSSTNLSGIYRSSDGGATWTHVHPEVLCDVGTAVVFDPSNGNIAYAAIGYPGGDGFCNGVYKSIDGGQTFGPIFALGNADVGRIALAIAPSSPSTLYVSIQEVILKPGALLGMFKTTDGGAMWTQLPAPDYCNPQCWYDNAIAVAPDNANIVYAGGSHRYDTDSPTSVIRSLDGGTSWSAVANGANGVNVHTDVHALAFSGDGLKLYVGSDGGAWSTTNIETAVNWSGLNSTLNITQFYPGLSMTPNDPNITFAGTQDNSTQAYGGTLTWTAVTCGDGGFTAIDFTTPANVYAACTRLNSPIINKSTSGGGAGSFSAAESGIDTTDRMLFIPPLVMDPSNSQTLYFGTYRLYKTSDGAGSWSPISYDLTLAGSIGTGHISAIAPAPSDPNTIYVGTDNSLVQVTRNANLGIGSTWTTISAGLPRRHVTQIAVAPNSSTTAYVSFSGFAGFGDSGHVFKTTNGGSNWADVTGNLPNIPVNDIVIDPDLPNTVYIATDVGAFVSTSGGTNWAPLGTGLPQVAVLGLRLQRTTRILRAATHGRGAWDLELPPTTFSLAVTLAGTGSGKVTSSPAGINCPGTCRANFNIGSVVTLAAAAGSNSIFAGWSRACWGRGACSVTMNDAQSVTATFITVPRVSLSATSLSFAPQPLGTMSRGQTVTLSNTGSRPLFISSIAPSRDFGKTSNCPITPSALAPGAHCIITVTFAPSVPGRISGKVTIIDNAGNSPQTIKLAGSGLPPLSPSPASQSSAR